MATRKIAINDYIARKLEGLASRVRSGAVRGFDLAWNMGEGQGVPHLLVGPMIVMAQSADEYVDALAGDDDVTAEDIQGAINKILVEDHSTDVVEIVDGEIEPPDMPDHVTEPNWRVFDPDSQKGDKDED